MQKQMLGIQRHIRRRVLQGAMRNKKEIQADWAAEGWTDGIEAMIREERWGCLWERWARSRPNAMEESSLRRFKDEFRKVVVCHVDKHNSEGMLVCPRVYFEALREFAGGMRRLSGPEAKAVFNRIGTAGCGLRHLPFSNLRKTAHHRFGCLRLWPKLKVFRHGKPLWEDFKWRPLVSFKRHRWKRVLGLLSQF